ncbi:MAG: DegV family protein, partial [Lachnospiraceae bacterium]|nr:DegV family protein [Lachnospiraceae bacterium]
LEVRILPFSYSINDEVIYYHMNREDPDISEFYGKLKKGAMPMTSQINPNSYKEFFENILKEGKDILYLSFSSGLSGSYQTSRMAIDMLEDKYPEAKIVSLDSLCASIGEGVFLYEASKKKEAGMNMEELADWIMENRQKVSHWFMVEDLFHLKRGGRVNTVEAMVGTALKIKPILSVDEEGKLIVMSKARGVNKALEYIVSKLVEEGGNLAELTAVIGHADSIEKANKLKEMAIDAGMKEENIMTAPIGPIIGTHVGAGMAAMAFIRKN